MAGLDNVVADTLSRLPPAVLRGVNAITTGTQLDYNDIAAAQLTCPDTATTRDSSLTLQMVEFGPYKLLADTSGDSPRPLIPAAYRRQVFDTFHGTTPPRCQGDQEADWTESGVEIHGTRHNSMGQ